MLNWQPQTGDMASYHRRKEIQHVWKAPSSTPQLCESNSIPLISFRHAAFCGFPTRPIPASHLLYLHQRKHGKIQGNPICAADPSLPGAVLSCAPCFSRTSSLRLYFEHNARAFTTASGRRRQLRQRASRSSRPTRKASIALPTKGMQIWMRRSVRCFLA